MSPLPVTVNVSPALVKPPDVGSAAPEPPEPPGASPELGVGPGVGPDVGSGPAGSSTGFTIDACCHVPGAAGGAAGASATSSNRAVPTVGLPCVEIPPATFSPTNAAGDVTNIPTSTWGGRPA